MSGSVIQTCKIALSLYLGCCFMLSLPCSKAIAQPVNSQAFADGWILINPPAVVHIHDHFEPYFSVDIDSKPINMNLPPNIHPMAKILNQYEVLHIQPNPEKIDWQNNVLINGTPRTTNIVRQLVPSLPHPQSNPVVRKNRQRSASSKNFGQKIGTGIGLVVLGIIALPFILLALLICSPFMISTVVSKRNSNQISKSQKLQDSRLKKIFKQMDDFTQLIDALQQDFQYKPGNTMYGYNAVINNIFNVLPSKSYYELDLSQKTLKYLPQQKAVVLTFQFQKPYPTLAEVQENFNNSSFRTLPRNKAQFNIDDVSLEPIHGKPHVTEIHQCMLTYSDNYTDKALSCSGATTFR